MRILARGLAALLLAAPALHCAHRAASPTSLLDEAAERGEERNASGRTLALAGFHAYLVKADPGLAQQRFDAALARDASDPYGLFGQHLLARRQVQPARALAAALHLVERAPRHPLALPAARYALEAVGTSPTDDALIRTGARSALSRGAAGEVAQLLRSALVAVHAARGEAEAQRAVLDEMGAATSATLVGPFSGYDLLGFDSVPPPEKDGSLTGPWPGPYGELTARTLPFPDGRARLAGEPPRGDLYVLAYDLEVKAAGLYALRTVTPSAHRVVLDGARVLERRSFERLLPAVSSRTLALEPGRHRVVITLAQERESALSFAVLRADGRPSGVTLTPARGAAPRWSAPAWKTAPGDVVFPAAADLERALSPEAGPALAHFIAIRDGMARDRDGAKRLMDSLVEALATPPVLGLRAELSAGDRTVPSKVAKGRASRDLELVLSRDAGDVAARLLRAELALEDEQGTAALEALKGARAAGPPSAPVLLLQARAALALQVEAQALGLIDEALALQADLCEARALRYELARRRDAVAATDAALGLLSQCPGALDREANHARLRGQGAASLELLTRALARDPSSPGTAVELADAHVAERHFDEATRVLQGLLPLWPRNAALLKRLADVREYAGARDEALALRERALALEGEDLTLRRAVVRARTGKELLEAHAIDGRRAIAAYEAARGTEDSAAAYVLDAAAVQVFPDGSVVNRVHIVQKALETSGVQEIAEVNLPPGAQVLSLRTLKADGTALEPESIEGKDSVSLPGVQVGDYVESEYLLAEPARGPAQPGFAAAPFYFQIAGQPNNWSTYTVVAPQGMGLRVDAHGMKAPLPTVKDGQEVFFHEERRVPPFIPEPDSPPSGNEYLPFVQVGAGATGNESVVTAYADAYLGRGVLTHEVEAFARAAVKGQKGRAAVRALHAAVMARFSGRDASLAQSAASTVAQDRGSRLWVLKSGLESQGFRTRIAAVRTFGVDPAAYLFPSEALLPYLCLRVEVPGEPAPLWLDTQVRYGPFAELPEPAAGEREAYLLPEPGRPVEKVRTPPATPRPGKRVTLTLALSEDGKLSGKGEEVYGGFEAAQLGEAFEQLSEDARQQALQGALSRYFGGAELSSVSLERVPGVGAPFTIRYAFVAPRFGRLESPGRIAMGPLTFPATLGRRYVQLGARATPLHIDSTEATETHVTLEVPEGYALVDPQSSLKIATGFGQLTRQESQQGRTVTLHERFTLPMARIPPGRYEAFSQFAGQVDLLQTRDLFLTRAGAGARAASR